MMFNYQDLTLEIKMNRWSLKACSEEFLPPLFAEDVLLEVSDTYSKNF